MDLIKGSLVLLFLIAVGTAEKGTPMPNNGDKDDEKSPAEKVKQEIENLSDDPLLKIKDFEKIGGKIARELQNMEPTETDDVIVSVHVFSLLARSDQNEVLEDLRGKTKSRIHIPTEKIRNTPHGRYAKKDLTVVTAWWKNISGFPQPQNGILPQNSTALSVSYFLGQDTDAYVKESLPVGYYIDLQNDFTEITSLKANERLRGYKRTCAWLDVSSNQWNDTGCITTYDEYGVNCVCDHTTTFVTLLTLDKNVVVTDEVQAVTMAFEITTILCLLATILFICVARQGLGIDSTFTLQVTGMNANRTNSQISLCLSLLGLHLVIVWSDFARSNSNTGCVVITVLTQYFLLASAFWSFCEGLGVFVKVCPSLTMRVPYRVMTIAQSILGWVSPFFITTITAVYGIKRGTYMDEAFAYTHLQNRTHGLSSTTTTTPQYDECWLSKTNGMIWAALGPMIVILVLNLVIICYVTNEVVRMNRTDPIRNLELSESQYGGSNFNTIQRGQSPTPSNSNSNHPTPTPTPTPPNSNVDFTTDGARVSIRVDLTTDGASVPIRVVLTTDGASVPTRVVNKHSQRTNSIPNTIRRGPSPTPSVPSNMDFATAGASVPITVVKKHSQKTKYMISVTRSFSVLMPILAVPWILAIFSNFPDDDVASVFVTAHALINGLQGLQIFLLYCVVNKRGWRIVKRKWRNSELRRLFINYKYNRRGSVATTSIRVVYEPKYHNARLDSNGNAFANGGSLRPGNVANYDTLSSCRSSNGTITSAQSRGSSMTKLTTWWNKK